MTPHVLLYVLLGFYCVATYFMNWGDISMESDLGYFVEHGDTIISLCLLFYLLTYTYLAKEYEYIDEPDASNS